MSRFPMSSHFLRLNKNQIGRWLTNFGSIDWDASTILSFKWTKVTTICKILRHVIDGTVSNIPDKRSLISFGRVETSPCGDFLSTGLQKNISILRTQITKISNSSGCICTQQLVDSLSNSTNVWLTRDSVWMHTIFGWTLKTPKCTVGLFRWTQLQLRNAEWTIFACPHTQLKTMSAVLTRKPTANISDIFRKILA